MDKKLKDSIKAAYTEFEKEPMSEYYNRPIIGYISRLRVKKIVKELKLLNKLSNKVVLDAGCEEGYIALKLIEKDAKVIALDICEPAILKFKEKLRKLKKEKDVKLVIAPIQKTTLKDNSVDAVVCSEVIEHAPYLNKTMKEMERVLKPGGILIITFPNEKIRKHLYPFIKIFGVDTGVEKDVTLYSYSLKDIVKACQKHFKILKVYSIPPILKITHFIICKKEL